MRLAALSEASYRLDEIATCARDQHSSRNVNQVIQMYDEFLCSLADKHMQVPEAASGARHSAVEFFSAMVYCVVRAGRFNLVERLLDDMITQGVARPLHFYESTMKQLAGVKKYKLALAVFDRLSADGLQPSSVTLSCLINFAVEVGELNRAIQFFKVLATVSTPSIRAYMTLLRVHSMRQDWPATLWTIRDMRRRGVEVDTLAMNVALSTGVVADQIEEVEALLAEAPSADIVSYNTLAKGYAQRGDLAKSQQVLAKLLERGLRPNAITFNTVMDAAIRSGDIGQAWQLLDSMTGRGLRADRFTCSILIKGLTKHPSEAHVKRSLTLLRQVAPLCDKTFLTGVFQSVIDACQAVDDGQQLAKQAVLKGLLLCLGTLPNIFEQDIWDLKVFAEMRRLDATAISRSVSQRSDRRPSLSSGVHTPSGQQGDSRVLSHASGDGEAIPEEAVPWLILLVAVGVPLSFWDSSRALPVQFLSFFGQLFGRTPPGRKSGLRQNAPSAGARVMLSEDRQTRGEDPSVVEGSLEAPASWQDLLKAMTRLEAAMSSQGGDNTEYAQSLDEVARFAQLLENDAKENSAAWSIDLQPLRRLSGSLRTAPDAPALDKTKRLISTLISRFTSKDSVDPDQLLKELEEEAKSDARLQSML
ncbi:unnamed protein product, partial [Symbiodinium natans]